MTEAHYLSDAVRLDRPSAHVAVVTIDRPEARNAVSVAVTAGIARALELTEGDVDTWVVVLASTGDKAFSAGADLKEIAAGRAMGLRTDKGGFAGLVNYPREKPWIAAVEGMALGGGLELVLACDMVVATRSASFGLPEVQRGLIAGAGGLHRLPRAIPRNVALELICTGVPITAERAFALGLVNRVVEVGQALESAVDLAQKVCVAAPVAVRESLRVARAAPDLDDVALRAMTIEARERNARSDDSREGPLAFIEKRKPNWAGR